MRDVRVSSGMPDITSRCCRSSSLQAGAPYPVKESRAGTVLLDPSVCFLSVGKQAQTRCRIAYSILQKAMVQVQVEAAIGSVSILLAWETSCCVPTERSACAAAERPMLRPDAGPLLRCHRPP